MAYWLLKTEPSEHSFADLERDGRAVWNGVANNQALIHMRAAKKGDRAVIYHTGDERAAVGLARLTSDPYPDPALDDPKRVVFEIAPDKRLRRPVTLAEIKADPSFAGFDLVRLPRLSVMPVPAAVWKRLLALGK